MSVVNPALVKEISSLTRNGTTIYIELQRVEQKIHKDEIFGYDIVSSLEGKYVVLLL
ncbi:hypothetical protein HanRHA438_Chr15g0692511 [Helianthus annuus]|uniref:Uncharacterized protein n=1 Tax=Helianthus annuus TaxID=4232 RepID=A0A251S6G0_HELAN|nr:hypothetical protein HanXRQr2_Chr15g0680301 [Helianthus annuus]KAJ0843550.1 hypothetical protein HanRHA438_Chr15g0692511 [Helianthus annuus]